MKKYIPFFLIGIAIICCCIYVFASYTATCTGSKNCRACKNCKYCKHCAKQGGTCGACRG